MKRLFLAVSLLLLIPVLAACNDDAAETAAETSTEPATAAAQIADADAFYALGFAVSQNLRQFDLSEEELAIVQEGIVDGAAGREPRVDVEQLTPRLRELAQQRAQRAAETERAAGQGFLDQSAAEEGATRTASGLIITTLTEGSGPSPAPDDVVRVHYHGTLRDGTVFDSSRGADPVAFPLNQMIPCWSEGLGMMKVGGKAKLVCPPDLAYGDRANGPIPAGSTLIFEVELLGIGNR